MDNTPGKKQLVERAIEAYIDDFDKNNLRDGVSLRNETVKWTAAATFAMNWDVDADDMLSMWKKCTNKAFIDTTHSHPTQGITLLLKDPEEREGVRNAFRNLFQGGTDDADQKWERILSFMEYVNGRLQARYPNSSIYLQTKEGVITYLNLWDPDHNYRYKPMPANVWASYIGYADWETGQRFSLRKYYKMCDEIHEVVKDHEELLRVHRQRFESGIPDCDKELHILTFDVLYCFWGHDEARHEALQEYEAAKEQQRIDELEDQRAMIDDMISEKTAQIKEVNCVCCVVRHSKFGKGTVQEVSGNHIVVGFEKEGSKTFQYPKAIISGFLRFEDEEILGMIENNGILEKEINSLQEQRKRIKEELLTVNSYK